MGRIHPLVPTTSAISVQGKSKPVHKTRCKNSNNPAGHNPECSCGWARASQVVPYMREQETDDV